MKSRFLLRVLCAVLFLVGQGHADTSARDFVDVRVVLVGPAHTYEFAELLQEWLHLQELRARVRFQSRLSLDDLVTGDDSSSVRVWLTLRSSEQARLYFADARGRRFHVRDVPLDDGLNELGREKVAQVVLASVLAFVDRSLPETPLDSVKQALTEAPAASDTKAEPLERASTPSSESAPPGPTAPGVATARAVATTPAAPAAREAAATPESARMHAAADASQEASWVLALRYHALFRGPEGWAHGPGLDLEFWPVLQRFGLGLVIGGRYEWPHSASSANLDLRLQTTALRAAAVFATLFRGRPRWALSVGAGWDWYRFDPESTNQGVIVSNGATDSRAVACVAAGFALPIGGLRIDLALGADLPMTTTHYDILVAGEEQRELVPWPIQPHASLGLAW